MAINITSNDPRLAAATQAIAAQRQLASANTAVNKVRASVSAWQFGMIDALATVASGGSKMEAVMSGIGTAITIKLLGPLGLFAGAAYAALKSVKELTVGLAKMGTQGAGGMETVVNQFRTLLKGMQSARERARELRSFADFTPFGFKDVSGGDKALQTLTKGALSTKDGLTLAGDAAAVAGTQFAQMAGLVGRVYDGLSSGRPIGEVLQQLQELGVVSGQTRNALEAMQASGASFTDMWRLFESDLKRSRGAMDNISKTLEGLQSTYEDATDTMSAGFGEGFLQGEKQAIDSMTKAVERLTPVTDYYGRLLGKVMGVQDKMQAKFMETATKVPGMETALKGIGTTVLAVSAAILGSALYKGVFRGLGALKGASLGANTVTKGAGGYAVGAGASVKDKVKNDLAGAGTAAGDAFRFAMALSMQQAFSALVSSVGKVASAFRAGGLTASLMILGNAFKFVGAQIAWMGRMLLANPVTLALAAVATVGWMVYDAWSQARKAVDAYGSATGEILARLKGQADAIQTVQDLSKAYADTLRELGKAHEEAARAAVAGDKDMESVARGRIAGLKVQQMELEKLHRANLRRPEEYYERQTGQRTDARETAESRRNTQQELMGNESKLRDLQAQREEMAAQAAVAKRLFDGLTQVQDAQAAGGDAAVRAAEKLAEMRGEMASLQARAEQLRPQMVNIGAHGLGGIQSSVQVGDAQKFEEAQTAIEALRLGIEKAEEAAQEVGQSLRIALDSDNELAILQQKLALYDAYQSAVQNAAAARQRLNELVSNGDANPEELSSAEDTLKKSENDQASLKRIADQSGVVVGPEGAGQSATLKQRLAEIKSLASEQEKIARLAAQDRAIAQQALEVWRSRRAMELQVAEQIAAATDNAYEAELKRLDLSRERLALEVQEADKKAEIIEAEGRSRAAALRKAGRGGEADWAEKNARAAADATRSQARAEEERQRKGVDAAEEAFKRDQARQRAQSEAAVEAARMREDAADQRRLGNHAGARAIDEAAARKEDEVERPLMERRYRDQGMSPAQAQAEADKELQSRARGRQRGQADEGREEGFAQNESSGRQRAEDLRTRAMQAEIRGYADHAAALREAAIQTEKAATFEARVVERMEREGITRDQAVAKVKQSDAQEQQQRQIEMDQAKKRRDLVKEGLKSENKARRREMGGNEESAARVRDKQIRKEREQELKEMGVDEKEAAKQAKREERDARRKRRQEQAGDADYENKPDLRQRVSTLQRIGGGGAVYGAGSHAPRDLFGRLDKMIKYMQAQHEMNVRSAGKRAAVKM
ncbi:hypothetical protein [Verrucomicrobium sp. BvORR034]|uniref:hypothetical protein n=1 Tax=Verrucomicrobium sp. BvORR034 TaxID=1396418 RepID=UPI0006790EC5|nr:hypothetical protein [Verrucomicrobium sp. BvORR034]